MGEVTTATVCTPFPLMSGGGDVDDFLPRDDVRMWRKNDFLVSVD